MPLTAAITASDADSTTLAGATVWISGNYQSGQDVLSFTNTANITGSWNAATGTLISGGNDTLADYQAALQVGDVPRHQSQSQHRHPDRELPSQRRPGREQRRDRQITVTPVGSLVGYRAHAAGLPGGRPGHAVTAAITVSDPESTTPVWAAVRISGNYQLGEDVLNFADTANITSNLERGDGDPEY